MKIPLKLPKNKKFLELKKYFLRIGLKILVDNYELADNLKDTRNNKKTYKPDLNDLYRLHRLVILNKRINILEYGTGWSTLVMSHALQINKTKYENEVKNFRFKNKFSISTIDNEKKFLNISRKRVKKYYKNKKSNVFYFFSENKMSLYKKRICSNFINHPRIVPDLIYVDGPDQFKIKGKINNLTIADYEMSPMNSDILSFEHFLCPGTIIVFDGRTSNARFLNSNLQRNWYYIEDKKNNQHIFYLNENPLGEINKKQLLFYKK